MRLFIFAVLLSSVSVFADPIDLSFAPARPVVLYGAFHVGTRTVRAPWIKSRFMVDNQGIDAMTVDTLDITVTSAEGQTHQYSFHLSPALQIYRTFTSSDFYVDNLPVSKSSVYSVHAQLSGWYTYHRDQLLSVETNFLTQ